MCINYAVYKVPFIVYDSNLKQVLLNKSPMNLVQILLMLNISTILLSCFAFFVFEAIRMFVVLRCSRINTGKE